MRLEVPDRTGAGEADIAAEREKREKRGKRGKRLTHIPQPTYARR